MKPEGYIKIIKSYIQVGNISEAEKNLEIITKLDPTNRSIPLQQSKLNKLKTTFTKAKLLYENKNYIKAITLIKKGMKIAQLCAALRILLAKSLVFLKRFQEAKDVSVQILKTIDRRNVNAMYIAGLSMYYMDKIDLACTNFQSVLKLDPNHIKTIDMYLKAKLLVESTRKGRECFKSGKFKESFNFYTNALSIDHTNDLINSKLYYNRATVLYQLGNLKEAIEDCSASLNLNNKYIKAILRKAKCYFNLKQYDEAVSEYETAYNMEKKESIRILLDEAKSHQNRSTERSYYDILGIQKNASLDEIKKDYRKRALKHHPDRHVNAAESKRKGKGKKFKTVGEAHAHRSIRSMCLISSGKKTSIRSMSRF